MLKTSAASSVINISSHWQIVSIVATDQHVFFARLCVASFGSNGRCMTCPLLQTKKFYKLVKKAAKDKVCRRGVKEVGATFNATVVLLIVLLVL